MALTLDREFLEARLNDFDPNVRRDSLDGLLELVARGDIRLPEPGAAVNLHAHTFFSYNGYGYSPTCYAWKARLAGLAVAGTVDFDVLDAVDEFLSASRRLGLKACAGLETRVFLPEFADREINSPGEPGIAYHMGTGFTSTSVRNRDFLEEMKEAAQGRNRAILDRVNSYLEPAVVDYVRDVMPLTPRGNATERHLCAAYESRAVAAIPGEDERAAFWADRLGEPMEKVRAAFANSPDFQGIIRAKTMKRGGVGYVQPEGPDFPRLEQVNAFILGEGAIPTFAWLDGTTAGEQAIDELLDLHQSHGAAALNIIPDRSWNIKDPKQKKLKLKNMYRIVEIAQERGMPVVAGTEMNAYGQRFVDDFDAPEMQPLVNALLEGAHILYAHTALQSQAGLGYLSEWARKSFAMVTEKNAFFAQVGAGLNPERWETLNGLGSMPSTADVLARLKQGG